MCAREGRKISRRLAGNINAVGVRRGVRARSPVAPLCFTRLGSQFALNAVCDAKSVMKQVDPGAGR